MARKQVQRLLRGSQRWSRELQRQPKQQWLPGWKSCPGSSSEFQGSSSESFREAGALFPQNKYQSQTIMVEECSERALTPPIRDIINLGQCEGFHGELRLGVPGHFMNMQQHSSVVRGRRTSLSFGQQRGAIPRYSYRFGKSPELITIGCNPGTQGSLNRLYPEKGVEPVGFFCFVFIFFPLSLSKDYLTVLR